MQFGCHLPMFGPVATRENVLRFALGVSTVLLEARYRDLDDMVGIFERFAREIRPRVT
jgi:hypothetical protein